MHESPLSFAGEKWHKPPPREAHSPRGGRSERPYMMTRTEWDGHGKKTAFLRKPENHVQFPQLFEILKKTKEEHEK